MQYFVSGCNPSAGKVGDKEQHVGRACRTNAPQNDPLGW